MWRWIFVWLSSWCSVQAVAAAPEALSLAPLFGEHMVLQRDQPLQLWGRGTPGAELRLALAGREGRARVDAQGRWRVTLRPLPAGGPHELVVRSGSSSVRLADLWMGDVWLCGGQSNMAWPLSLSQGGADEVARSDVPLLRHLRVAEHAALQPQDDIPPAPWVVARPGASGDFTAVGWYFARRLQAAPGMAGVPIGLINVAWNASHLETWVRHDAALSDPDLAAAVRRMPASEAEFGALLKQRIEGLLARFQPGLAWPVADADGFAAGAYDDSAWPTLEVPRLWEEQGLPGLDGVVWFRKTVVLSAAQADGSAVLQLAKVDDCDDSYVNGQRVGGQCQWDAPRRYELRAGLLKEGRNVIAVRVNDTGGGGGFHGDAALVRLDTAAGPVPLAGPWKARVAAPLLQATPTANDGVSLAHNGMVHPLHGLKLRGVLWYQGESNTGRAAAYAGQFQRLITDWRAQFGQPALPFLFVQLSSVQPLARNDWQQSGWAELRDAQRQALVLPNTAMAVTLDVGDENDIHPRDKRTVGERLALQALHLADPRQPASRGPVLASARADGTRMVLTFDLSGLVTHPAGAPPTGFAVAGADRVFRPATARIDGARVIVSHPDVPQPVAVRYGWLDNPSQSNLFDAAGLPATPFRTDTWPLSTAGVRFEP